MGTEFCGPDARSDDPTRNALLQAVREANLLVAYASENGIELRRDVVERIVQSQRLLHEPPVDDDVAYVAQTDFWVAYQAAAMAVLPASPSSIEATTEKRGRRGVWGFVADRAFGPKLTTHAQRSVFWFWWLSFAILVLLLVSQVYWVIGSRLEDQSSQLITQAEDIRKQPVLQKKSQTPEEAAEAQQREASEEQLNLELGIRVDALNQWNHYWGSVIAFLSTESSPSSKAMDPTTVEEPFTTLRKAKLEASLAIECIELYVLPLLYGLLGACLHVLRTLTSEIRARTYDADRLYGIRIYTGGLAGLVIGWFGIANDSGSSLASLTPFALALLAGYSVELLFAFMDRIVAAFTGKPDGSRNT